MEISFDNIEESDDFVMTLQTISVKIDIKVKFSDRTDEGFSTYEVEIYEDAVLVLSEAFVQFPSAIMTDYAPNSFNLEEVKNKFNTVSNSWYEYFSQIRATEEKKQVYINSKLESGLFYN